jgi:hypothetical protein
MSTFTLTKTALKNGKFLYQVKDENGTVITDRISNREYAACTADGSFYFGRVDLIGKADHGTCIKYASGWGWDSKRQKLLPNIQEVDQARLEKLNQIAYLETK